MGELNIFSDRSGGYCPDPVTGVEQPTRIRVTEYLDSARDLRRYAVEHVVCHSGRVIRSARFQAVSYMGAPGNWCGDLESRQARDLGDAWYAEGVRALAGLK